MKNMTITIAALISAMLHAADFDVRKFGAKGNGTDKDTVALQAAIDECTKNGGGRVVLADGTFLTGALQLKSGVELYIDRTAKLLASPDIADFPDFTNVKHVITANLARPRNVALIFADEANNIAITGGGTIDCNGKYHIRPKKTVKWDRWHYERIYPKQKSLPRVVFLAGCSDIVIKDVTMTGQPAGWSYWIHDCDRVQISGLKVLANVRYPNNDGIHVNCSRDVTISDCILETGDDAIVVRANSRSLRENKPCERVVVTGCTIHSWSCGIRIGWINDGVIRNCSFSNIVMHDTVTGIGIELPGIGSRTDYGREATLIENLTFANITMDGIYNRPVKISIDQRDKKVIVAGIRDLRFSNVRANGAMFPALSGRIDCPLRDIVFSGCDFKRITNPEYSAFTHREMAKRRVADKGGDMVFRHTIGVRFNDTEFTVP